MSHIKDCKDCISYAICRSTLIDRISRSVNNQKKNFNVVGSYAYLIVTRCEIQEKSLSNIYLSFKSREYDPGETNSIVADIILEVFDIDYDSYLKRVSE